ncbi:purine-cytosine permease family protein [Rhodococcus tukisamuensis]|uniref:Putative hydroxymethylpyrimidine transporter CytX n=1 Tax=Rhodococcus tukisamuensis TaxID=168276 RepID=A0A1G6XHZ7_9NOCA|nr:cytosine permease [Rhodococcus tukisamuensis]SDD77692.1 putative hydroxymethylpyrimidine transporter CytX [Rhodococcus tukisamuensis]
MSTVHPRPDEAAAQPSGPTSSPAGVEPSFTLDEAPARTLGLAAQIGLWGNLGISLLLPVAATFAVLQGQSLLATLLAVLLGAVIGSTLLGLCAAAGATVGAPAMVMMRGLLGNRLSALPTVFNLVQCVGWATFEVFVIAEAAARLTGWQRWPFVLLGGALATVMALRPLKVVGILARYAVWAALASTVYLLVNVLMKDLPSLTDGSFAGFWTSVDLVIAMPISWVPLAADYARHSKSPRAAFLGATVGYGGATVAFFSLGVLAFVAFGLEPGFDIIGSLLVLPLAGVALLILLIDEVDEAFANIYSTAMSAQNLRPSLDRRYLVVGVGAVATLLALTVDAYSYEPFLFLIGAVFVPLTGTFLVAFYLLRRGSWDVSASSPARWEMLLPWAVGFVVYQLVTPTYFTGFGAGWTQWWTDLQSALGIPATGWSASLISLVVAAAGTALIGLIRRRKVVPA